MLLIALLGACGPPVPDLGGRWEGRLYDCANKYGGDHIADMTLTSAEDQGDREHSGTLLLFTRTILDDSVAEWLVEFEITLESGRSARRKIPQEARFIEGYCVFGWEEVDLDSDCLSDLFSVEVRSGEVVSLGEWRWDWEHERIDLAWSQPQDPDCQGTFRRDD